MEDPDRSGEPVDDCTATTARGRSGTDSVRRAELDRLVAAVSAPREAEAVTGRVDALLTVVGGSGTGKTTLVEAVVARFVADGGRALRAAGSQSETHLAFSGLHQLLRPVRGRIDALPSRQREALHIAFGVAERSEAPDPMLIGAAVLTMLSDLAAERPLLVVVDDAQWADHASLDALSFAARRLADEPVTLLIATGDPALRALAAREPTLTLEPLGRGAAERLLDLQPRVPAGLTRASILDQAEGNPLALVNWPGPPATTTARPARSTARFRSPNGWGGSTPTAWRHCPPRRAARWCVWPQSTTRTRRTPCCPGFPTSVIRCGRGRRGRTRPAKRGTTALRPPALPPRDLPHGPRRGAARGAPGTGRTVRRPGSRPACLAPRRRCLRAERGGLGPTRRQRGPRTSPQRLRGCRPHAGTGRGPAPRPGREHPTAGRGDQCGGPDGPARLRRTAGRPHPRRHRRPDGRGPRRPPGRPAHDADQLAQRRLRATDAYRRRPDRHRTSGGVGGPGRSRRGALLLR
ncbi:hypothetical protein CJI59_17165 [Streptomyces sp. Alain-F2R5]|nr:hypothetical protein CJI59_17165 [Streptomyces sp. Alain-F2R5]